MGAAVVCPFCEIAKGKTEGRTGSVLFQDGHILAFEDRSPSGYKHYLVVPVEHVKNIDSLKAGEQDHLLVQQMLKVGESLLQKDAPGADGYRFGFHRPPYNSVNHLHMHCMALPFRSWWGRLKFTSLGCLGGWISAQIVLERLQPTTT